MDPVPDPLLLRKSGSAGNRTRDLCVSSQKLDVANTRIIPPPIVLNPYLTSTILLLLFS
jgi:hypothetical protein